MSTNVIKQTLLGEPGAQTIKMVVRSNERGPKGEKGDPGPQGPQGLPGERGADGVIQYRAGTGIQIDGYNIISATGEAIATWGGIQGTISNQSDLAPYIKKEAPVWYGTCTTASGSFIKHVTTEKGNFEYNEGDILIVRFTNGNTSINPPTLTIDSGIGASVNMPAGWGTDYSGIWESGETVAFVYQKVNNNPYFFPISKTRATTSSYGMTKLYDNYDSSSTTLAPTANALRKLAGEVDVHIGEVISEPVTVEFVDTANIVDQAVTSKKIDYSSAYAYNSMSTSSDLTETYTTYLTVDVSHIPDGSTFMAVFSGGATGTSTLTAFAMRCSYNSTNGQVASIATTYGKYLSSISIFTKATGVNQLYVQAKKDNNTASAITDCACVCTIINN